MRISTALTKLTLVYLLSSLFLVISTTHALGQPKEISTIGKCSPIVDRTKGDVSIKLNCTNELTDEQIEQIVTALQSVLEGINQPLPTDSFYICLAIRKTTQIEVNSYTFPFSDIPQNGDDFFTILRQLPNVELDASSVFRFADEKIITSRSGSPLGDRNNGVLIIPTSVIGDFFNNDTHFAFTYIKNHQYCRPS